MDPAPLLQIRSIGHPMFMSTKSIPPRRANSSSMSCAHRETASGYPPQICAPKTSSDACRRSSAHSAGWPWSRFVHSAISPHVMSAPRPLHTRRKGKFPTVVRGAKYSLPLKSTSFFSAARSRASTPPASPSDSSGQPRALAPAVVLPARVLLWDLRVRAFVEPSCLCWSGFGNREGARLRRRRARRSLLRRRAPALRVGAVTSTWSSPRAL